MTVSGEGDGAPGAGSAGVVMGRDPSPEPARTTLRCHRGRGAGLGVTARHRLALIDEGVVQRCLVLGRHLECPTRLGHRQRGEHLQQRTDGEEHGEPTEVGVGRFLDGR